MPRDGNGNYTLPAGNPVVPGSLIESDWANPTMSDLATEVQDSLSRSGKGGMLVPFNNVSGTAGNPGITFTIDNQTGRYLFNVGDMRDSVGGVDVMRYQSSLVTALVDYAFAGNVTFDTLASSGLATLDSLVVTNNATAGSINSDSTIDSVGDITSGGLVKSNAAAPVDPEDLTRKDYVDGEIANIDLDAKVDKVQPAGDQLLIAINGDSSSGIFYNSVNNSIEFKKTGAVKARIDLDTGAISSIGSVAGGGLI